MTAARQVIESYDPIVRTQARRLLAAARQTGVLDIDDLQTVGRMAVLEAIDKYTGGAVTRDTFIRVRIRQRMIDEIRARQNAWTRSDLEVMRREPDSDRAKILQWRARPVAIDHERHGSEAPSETIDIKRHIATMHLTCTPKQADAVRRRYLMGQTLSEIANALGGTEANAYMLVKRGLRNMQRPELKIAASWTPDKCRIEVEP